MRYRYGPEDPEPWSAFEPAQRPGDRLADYPTNPDYPTDPDYLTWLDEPADAARTKGLRHLSRLTFCAAQLSTAAAVGFAALFAHTAHTQAVASPAPVRTSPARTSPARTSPARTSPASPAPAGRSPSPASASTGSANNSGTAPAPARTLAPPTTPPAAPPPSPAPVQTTTSGTVGG
jgi:hypothetical protein